MTIPLQLESVHKYLKEKKYDIHFQSATNQLYIVFSQSSRDFPIFFRIDESPLMQIFLFLPTALQPNTNSEVARVLHLLNRQLDVPGFGMDEAEGLIFYRAALPSVDGQLSTQLLENAIDSIPRIGQLFFPVIVSAISGTAFKKIADQIKPILQQLGI